MGQCQRVAVTRQRFAAQRLDRDLFKDWTGLLCCSRRQSVLLGWNLKVSRCSDEVASRESSGKEEVGLLEQTRLLQTRLLSDSADIMVTV